MRALMLALALMAGEDERRPAPEPCECGTDAECESECDARICEGWFYCHGWCVASEEACTPPEEVSE